MDTPPNNNPTSSASDTNKSPESTSKYIIEIDRSKCISVANCVAIAGDVFILDSEQIAVFKDPDPTTKAYASDDDTIMLAARSCPTQAIIIKDKETGQQLFP